MSAMSNFATALSETKAPRRPVMFEGIGKAGSYRFRAYHTNTPKQEYVVTLDPHNLTASCSCKWSSMHPNDCDHARAIVCASGYLLPGPRVLGKQAELLAAQVAAAVKAPSPVGSKSRLETMYSPE